MLERTGQKLTREPESMPLSEIDKEIQHLQRFEAHVSHKAHVRLKALIRERNYRKTYIG